MKVGEKKSYFLPNSKAKSQKYEKYFEQDTKTIDEQNINTKSCSLKKGVNMAKNHR